MKKNHFIRAILVGLALSVAFIANMKCVYASSYSQSNSSSNNSELYKQVGKYDIYSAAQYLTAKQVSDWANYYNYNQEYDQDEYFIYVKVLVPYTYISKSSSVVKISTGTAVRNALKKFGEGVTDTEWNTEEMISDYSEGYSSARKDGTGIAKSAGSGVDNALEKQGQRQLKSGATAALGSFIADMTFGRYKNVETEAENTAMVYCSFAYSKNDKAHCVTLSADIPTAISSSFAPVNQGFQESAYYNQYTSNKSYKVYTNGRLAYVMGLIKDKDIVKDGCYRVIYIPADTKYTNNTLEAFINLHK